MLILMDILKTLILCFFKVQNCAAYVVIAKFIITDFNDTKLFIHLSIREKVLKLSHNDIFSFIKIFRGFPFFQLVLVAHEWRHQDVFPIIKMWIQQLVL